MTEYAYSVVIMSGEVSHPILHTDSLAHARKKVIETIRDGPSPIVLILRNGPALDPDAITELFARLKE